MTIWRRIYGVLRSVFSRFYHKHFLDFFPISTQDFHEFLHQNINPLSVIDVYTRDGTVVTLDSSGHSENYEKILTFLCKTKTLQFD